MPWKTGLFLFVVTVFNGLVSGQEPVQDACAGEQIAKSFAREQLQLGDIFLRAIRRTDWEEDLFQLQWQIHGQIAKPFFFYEVTDTGSFVQSPFSAIRVIADHGARVWVVGVNRKTGAAQGLFGFPESVLGFNKIMDESGLRVDTEEEAEGTALLFFGLAHDPAGRRYVPSSMKTRHRVEWNFSGRFTESRAIKRTARWWQGFKNRVGSANIDSTLGTHAKMQNGHFEVSISHLAPVGDSLKSEPRLLLDQVNIDERGRVSGHATRQVFPTP